MPALKKICEECEIEFVTPYERQRFCNRSCSNKGVHRRTKKEVICFYAECSNVVDYYTHKFCRECKDLGRHRHKQFNGRLPSETTLEEYCPRKGANAYDSVRANARTSVKQEIADGASCAHCSYSKHVEVCHIKPIALYDRSTTIDVINARENLILLCPNCHWEFDHK